MWLHVPHVKRGQTFKLHKPWQGPYTVVKVLSDVTYSIQSVSGRNRQVVHFDRLTQATKDTNNPPTELPPSEKSECDTADDRQTARTAEDDIIDKERIVPMQLYADDPGDRWPSNEKRRKKSTSTPPTQNRPPEMVPPLTHSWKSAKETTETPGISRLTSNDTNIPAATPHGPLTPNTDCRPLTKSTKEQAEVPRKRRLPFWAKDYDLNCISKLETSYYLEGGSVAK